MYICGATPQAAPHIGHLRSGVVYDLLRRWLITRGYDVTLVRNVTDIDDKIISTAAERDVPWFVVAEEYQRIFSANYETLGCLPPTVEPRVTGHVPEMMALIQRLINVGYAYPRDGDVRFNLQALMSTSEGDELPLSRQRLEHVTGEYDDVDFALWKAAKPGEPAWETPWGPGRPGWHLECSAMATKYLGETFDIHGGGVDLIFPHHENERLQSRTAGDAFANYWVHNGLLTVDGKKMSKSDGNVLTLKDLLKVARPVEIRYYLGSAHYRSLIDYSELAMYQACVAYRRIEDFLRVSTDLAGPTAPTPSIAFLPDEFITALDDDLSVPRAISTLHYTVYRGNRAIKDGDVTQATLAATSVVSMLDVLGLNPLVEPWARADDLYGTVDELVKIIIRRRDDARTRRDFVTADALRDELLTAGITVLDTASGSRWVLSRDR